MGARPNGLISVAHQRKGVVALIETYDGPAVGWWGDGAVELSIPRCASGATV